MRKKTAFAHTSGLVMALLLLWITSPSRALAANPAPAQVDAQLAGLAVPFVANDGQSDPQVAYYAPTFAGTVFVTRQGEIVHALPGRRGADHQPQSGGWTLTESFVGGHAVPVAAQPSAINVSLFSGNDPRRWRAHTATSAAVNLGEVYPGIAVQLKAHGKQVEKVFTVEPGAAVGAIRVRVAGAQGMAVTPDGALAVRTGLGEVRLTQPVAYQEINGRRQAVAATYAVAGDTYGFRVASYDTRWPVVIDPLLQVTYLVGSSGYSYAGALAISPTTGEVYVAGTAASTNFPGTSGGAQPASAGVQDAFVARLNASLTTLDQATYLGGSSGDDANALAISPTTGEVYVAGLTYSTDFPGTSGGAQSGHAFDNADVDGFVARLNANLTTLDQATYLGGSSRDIADALAINPTTGEVYVAGETSSRDFPGTSGGVAGPSGNFVARLNANLTTLDQATYLPGDSPPALAFSPTTDEVYVAGATTSTNFPGTSGGAQSGHANDGGYQNDGFVARLNANLSTLDQATYLGGSGDDYASALALNATTGEVYVAGATTSGDFPGTSGGAAGPGVPGFVARLNANLTTLDQATYLVDRAAALALNTTTGEVYVAGSTDYNPSDTFVVGLNASLTTFDPGAILLGVGGYASALAFSPTTGEVYVAGTTTGAAAFVARLSADLGAGPTPTPPPTPTPTPEDSGFVPPDANTGKCEDLVAGYLKNLFACMMKCQTKQADAARRGLAFDEEACEQGTGKPLSCRTKYNNATTRLLARNPAICPSCLDATAQSNLADRVVAFIENNNGLTYCAGATPLPTP